MGPFWKLLTAALLTLPAGAYVTGTLVDSRADLPQERPPIVVDDSVDTEPGQTLTVRPRPGEASSPDTDDGSSEGDREPGGDDDRSSADGGNRSGGGARGEDDDLQIVHPDPDELDDPGDGATATTVTKAATTASRMAATTTETTTARTARTTGTRTPATTPAVPAEKMTPAIGIATTTADPMATEATTESTRVTTTADPATTATTGTATPAGATAEPTPAPTGLAGVSVRTRLTTAVALLTALALAAAGLLVYTLESAHVEKDVKAQIEQEVAEFEQLQQGNDPETARPFSSVPALIEVFLRHNVPDDDEVLVGYWDGGAKLSSPGSPHPGLVRSAAFLDLVEQRLERGGSRRIDTEYGEVIVTVAPVHGSRSDGALVVVNFMRDHRAELSRVMQTYVDRLAAAARADHRQRRVAGGAAAVPAPHAAGHRARDHRDRPVAPDPGAGQRRHHRAHPDVQRHGLAAGAGLHRPAPVPRRRRPRAAHAADGDERPPGAGRPDRPCRGRGRPATCCSTRSTG